MALSVGVRRLARWLGVLCLIACALAIACAFYWYLQHRTFQAITDSIAGQIDFQARALEIGSTAVIRVRDTGADEIIAIHPYLDRRAFRKALPDRSPELIRELVWLAGSDRHGTTLVWLKNDRVLSVNPWKIHVMEEFGPRSWKLEGGGDIRITKEPQKEGDWLPRIRFGE